MGEGLTMLTDYGYEEWDADDPETFNAPCERCGERKAVKLVLDPFVVEGIYEPKDRPSEEHWCGACFDERASDV